MTKGKPKHKRKRAPWMERALVLLMTPQRKRKQKKSPEADPGD